MKPRLPKKPTPALPAIPEWSGEDEDPVSDPDTSQRQAAHEACKEIDIPDFLDSHDYD